MKSPMPGTVNAKSPRSGEYASPESMMPFLTRTTSAGGRPSRSAISAELHTLFSSEAMALMYSRSSGRARCQRDSYRPLSSDACAMGSPLMTADNGIGDDSDSSKAAEPYTWMEYGYPLESSMRRFRASSSNRTLILPMVFSKHPWSCLRGAVRFACTGTGVRRRSAIW